jgi:hypothetical protein
VQVESGILLISCLFAASGLLRRRCWRDNFFAHESELEPAGKKRPVLHQRIDELPEEELDLVERVLVRLEMDRLWQQVQEGFTQDWATRKYDRLDEVIREVRRELKQRVA